MKAATILWLALVGGLLALIIYSNAARGGKHPLLIDARIATTAQDRKFTPCAPSRRHFPTELERTA